MKYEDFIELLRKDLELPVKRYIENYFILFDMGFKSKDLQSFEQIILEKLEYVNGYGGLTIGNIEEHVEKLNLILNKINKYKLNLKLKSNLHVNKEDKKYVKI